MSALISFNPMLTTSPQDSFLLDSDGFIQGVELDNQPNRIQLEQGSLLSTSTKPVWGAVQVNQLIPNVNTNALGNPIEIATVQNTEFAFTVISRAYNMIIIPGNSVPLTLPGMSCMYFPNGKWTRIPVQCSSSLATALEGGLVSQTVYWDFTNQVLTNTGTTALPCRVKGFNSNSLVVTYNATTGAATWGIGTCALIEF